MMRHVALALIGAIVSGALFAASLPPAHFGFLGWFAFVPLLAGVRHRGVLFGFLFALVTVFICAVCVQYGLFLPPEQRTARGEPAWIASACGIFGFVVLLLISASAEGSSTTFWRLFKLASFAILLEVLLLLELPAHLALTQYRSFLCLQLASVTGIWGVSFVLWLANLALADSLRARAWKPAVAILALAAVVSSVPFPAKAGIGNLRVAVLQTTKTDPKELARLNGVAAGGGAQIAVWPEFAGLEAAPQGDTSELRSISARVGQIAFVTSFNDDFAPRPHNVASLFSGGRESARYYKRNLFGGENHMHTRGTEAVAANWNGRVVGLNICYDSCFPATMLETARLPGVGFVALSTIDPDSPNGFFAAAHSAYSPFRAAELGVSILRADGYAYSSIVAQDGEILASAGIAPDTVVFGDIDPTPRWTFFKWVGDWFPYGAAFMLAVGVVLDRRARGYSKTSTDWIEPSGLSS